MMFRNIYLYNTENNKKYFGAPNKHIRIISEGSCNTEYNMIMIMFTITCVTKTTKLYLVGCGE